MRKTERERHRERERERERGRVNVIIFCPSFELKWTAVVS